MIGDIPRGPPSLSLACDLQMPLDKIALGSAAVFLVGFGAGIVTARSFGTRTGEEVDANQELIGLGAASIARASSGLFRSACRIENSHQFIGRRPLAGSRFGLRGNADCGTGLPA